MVTSVDGLSSVSNRARVVPAIPLPTMAMETLLPITLALRVDRVQSFFYGFCLRGEERIFADISITLSVQCFF